MREFYLYRHIRTDLNVPFYIGIGTKPIRFRKESQEFKRAFIGILHPGKRNNWWINIYNKTDVEVEIMYTSNSWEDVKGKEIEFIKLYGKLSEGTGTLVNLTDGGDGVFGMRHSEESRKKMSASHTGVPLAIEVAKKSALSRTGLIRKRGYKLSEDHKAKISKGNKGKKLTDDRREKLRLSAKTRKRPTPFSDEHRRNIGEASKKVIRTDQWRENISKGNIGKKVSNETRQILSSIFKGRILSDETKLKMSAFQKGRKHSDKTKQKMRKPKSESHRNNIKLGWLKRKTNAKN